jgi:hypothetical protein
MRSVPGNTSIFGWWNLSGGKIVLTSLASDTGQIKSSGVSLGVVNLRARKNFGGKGLTQECTLGAGRAETANMRHHREKCKGSAVE